MSWILRSLSLILRNLRCEVFKRDWGEQRTLLNYWVIKVLLSCKNSVLLLFVLRMAHSMKAKLSSLSEWLLTTVDSADEGFCLCVNEHMLLKVLLKCKAFPTQMTTKVFHPVMGRLVSSKCKLRRVLLEAVRLFTDESSPLHFIIINLRSWWFKIWKCQTWSAWLKIRDVKRTWFWSNFYVFISFWHKRTFLSTLLKFTC